MRSFIKEHACYSVIQYCCKRVTSVMRNSFAWICLLVYAFVALLCLPQLCLSLSFPRRMSMEDALTKYLEHQLLYGDVSIQQKLFLFLFFCFCFFIVFFVCLLFHIIELTDQWSANEQLQGSPDQWIFKGDSKRCGLTT